MELSVSVEASTGLVAVGWCEPGEVLPRDARILDPELAELVARAVGARLAHPTAGRSVDLDRMVAVSQAVLAARKVPMQAGRTRGQVGPVIPEPRTADRTMGADAPADPWFSA